MIDSTFWPGIPWHRSALALKRSNADAIHGSKQKPPRFYAHTQNGLFKPLADQHEGAYINEVTGSALLVTGYIPVALSKSEGVGSVLTLVWLSDAHL